MAKSASTAGSDYPGKGEMAKSDIPAIPEDVRQKLKETARDRVVSYVQAVISTAPWIGPVVAQALSDIIPNQRMDRIADVLARLDSKVQLLETAGTVRDRMLTPEGIDLLEEGVSQAARALSEERRERIATLLKNSLSDEHLGHLQKKTLLELFDQLNDVQILILQSHGIRQQGAEPFHEKHKAALYGPSVHLGSSQEEIDQGAVHETFRRELELLGLLKLRYTKPRKGEAPEFDFDTGTIKSRSLEITSLGRLLLRYLDMEVDR